MSHALAHCSRRIRAFVERGVFPSIRILFSENTVKSRERKREKRRRLWESLQVAVQQKLDKSTEWRKSQANTHECRLWERAILCSGKILCRLCCAILVNKLVVYPSDKSHRRRETSLSKIRVSLIYRIPLIFYNFVGETFPYILNIITKLITEIFNTVIKINYSTLSK